jgi:hypothetical protein
MIDARWTVVKTPKVVNLSGCRGRLKSSDASILRDGGVVLFLTKSDSFSQTDARNTSNTYHHHNSPHFSLLSPSLSLSAAVMLILGWPS